MSTGSSEVVTQIDIAWACNESRDKLTIPGLVFFGTGTIFNLCGWVYTGDIINIHNTTQTKMEDLHNVFGIGFLVCIGAMTFIGTRIAKSARILREEELAREARVNE